MKSECVLKDENIERIISWLCVVILSKSRKKYCILLFFYLIWQLDMNKRLYRYGYNPYQIKFKNITLKYGN